MFRKHIIRCFALFAAFVCLGCFIGSAWCGWYQRPPGRFSASELPSTEQSHDDGDFSSLGTLEFWAPFIVVALAAIGLSITIIYSNLKKKRL
jgi:hypothetical protein